MTTTLPQGSAKFSRKPSWPFDKRPSTHVSARAIEPAQACERVGRQERLFQWAWTTVNEDLEFYQQRGCRLHALARTAVEPQRTYKHDFGDVHKAYHWRC